MKETPAYLQALAAEYNLPNLEFVGVSDKGVSSYNAIAQTPDGSRFFVKQYKSDDAKRRVNSNKVERYIAEHSTVPVVLPLQTIAGKSQVYIDEKMYAVFPYYEHNEDVPASVEAKQKQIYELAKTLGSIHVTPTTKLVEVGAIERWEQKEVADRIAHLQYIEKTINTKQIQDAFDARALTVIQEKKKLLKAMEIADAADTSLTLCHGDYHSQNALFSNEMDLTGVVDWDICGLSDPYVDFLNTFKMTVIGRKYDTYQQERREDARSFVRGYVAGIDFKFDTERLKNAANTLAQVVVGSSWPLDEHYFMEYTKADDYLEKELEKAVFFYHHKEEMVGFISEVLGES